MDSIDLSTVIGVFPICNTGAVLIRKIDYDEDRVLAGINAEEPEWCEITEEYSESTEEMELGFRLGAFFVPLSEVQRFYQ